ncbi:MAG: hypothetical protein JWO38_2318 [Gemmataceae bacterium]|nr:hypothetical protein [Gemmataceae bacterium]
MKPVSRRQFLALSGAAAAHAAVGRTISAEPNPMTASTALAAGSNAFAFDLYAQLRKKPGNLFVSPFSIATALGMTSAGARGTTLDEMGKVLHLPEDPHPAFGELLARVNRTGTTRKRAYQLTTANAIWAQQGYPWRAAFTDLTRKYYGAGLVETDFGMPEEARRAINAWVEKETREKIKDLIPPGIITPLTLMVLTNAVYFKSDWAAQFKKEFTKDQPFTAADGSKPDVPLMTQTGTFGYGEFSYSFHSRAADRGQVLDLPYAGKDLSMLVLLPGNGLAGLEDQLSADTLATWTRDVRPQRVEVFLPRFKLEMKEPLRLGDPLKALGMKAAFGPADFSGMHAGQEKLFISEVLHKTFVDVNEEGTEAAAATAVVMTRTASVVATPKVFRADRPFLFLIRENTTGNILFLGRYANPKR